MDKIVIYQVFTRLFGANGTKNVKNGTLEEVWGTGTAAVISPVGKLRMGDEIMQVQDGGIGELSQRLYDEVTGIQLGKVKDTRGWIVKID